MICDFFDNKYPIRAVKTQKRMGLNKIN